MIVFALKTLIIRKQFLGTKLPNHLVIHLLIWRWWRWWKRSRIVLRIRRRWYHIIRICSRVQIWAWNRKYRMIIPLFFVFQCKSITLIAIKIKIIWTISDFSIYLVKIYPIKNRGDIHISCHLTKLYLSNKLLCIDILIGTIIVLE